MHESGSGCGRRVVLRGKWVFISNSLRSQDDEQCYENKAIQRIPPRCKSAKDKRALRNEDSRACY